MAKIGPIPTPTNYPTPTSKHGSWSYHKARFVKHPVAYLMQENRVLATIGHLPDPDLTYIDLGPANWKHPKFLGAAPATFAQAMGWVENAMDSHGPNWWDWPQAH
jgi:hypothetical protein